jgi:sterol desaturase/sphingolipid hydroxylase (fatty acid hydroxylase superfamily)
MTVFQFILVLVTVEAAVVGMFLAMRMSPPTTIKPIQIVIVVLCLVAIIGAFTVGSYWNHDDYLCKPGAHCFPWGD